MTVTVNVLTEAVASYCSPRLIRINRDGYIKVPISVNKF